MDDAPAGGERVRGRPSRSADQHPITHGFGQEPAVDHYRDMCQVRVGATVQEDLIHSMRIRAGRLAIGGEEALAFRVENPNLETISEKNSGAAVRAKRFAPNCIPTAGPSAY